MVIFNCCRLSHVCQPCFFPLNKNIVDCTWPFFAILTICPFSLSFWIFLFCVCLCVFHEWNAKIQNGKWKEKRENWMLLLMLFMFTGFDQFTRLALHVFVIFILLSRKVFDSFYRDICHLFLFLLAHTKCVHCALCIYGAQMMAHGSRMFIVCTWIFDCYAWFSFCANIFILYPFNISAFYKCIFLNMNLTECCKTVNPLTKQRHNINNNKRASNKLCGNWQSPLCSVVYVPMHLK